MNAPSRIDSKDVKLPAKKNRAMYIVIFAVSVLSSLRLLEPIIRQSATFDEPFKIGAAYLLAKDNCFDYDSWNVHIIFNPPLYKYLISLPLRFSNPYVPIPPPQREMKDHRGYFENAWEFGYRFVYENKVSAEKILIGARLTSLVLFMACGVLVFFLMKTIFGLESALVFSVLYFFCPNMAASAALATNDIHAAVLAAVYVAVLLAFLNKPCRKYAAIIGIAFTCGICVKASLILLAPLYILALALMLMRKRLSAYDAAEFAAFSAVSSFVLIEILFQFMEPSAIYKMFASVSNVTSIRQMYYLFGNYSMQGFLYYFPLAFLLKTPLPVLALLGFSGYVYYRERAYKNDAFIIITAGIAIFMFVALKSGLNAGMRYILPVYPLTYMFCAGIMQYRQYFRLNVTVLLLILLGISNFMIHPHYQSYFNMLIGKNEGAYKYFVDSSVDWGENLGDLANYLKQEGSPELVLSYFGSASPTYYGLTYQDLDCDGLDLAQDDKRFEHVNSDNPAKEYWAISATCLVGLNYPDHNMFGFLKSYTPLKVVGNNIFVYDITGDVTVHRNIARVYLQSGRMEHFMREGRMIHTLLPQDTLGLLSLSMSKYMRDKTESANILKEINLTPETLTADGATVMNGAMAYCGLMIQNKDYSSAHSLIARLIAANPPSLQGRTKLYNLSGVAFMRDKNFTKAKEELGNAITADPSYPVSYYNLGLVYEKLNNPEQAESMYRKALAYNPRFIPAIRKLKSMQSTPQNAKKPGPDSDLMQ